MTSGLKKILLLINLGLPLITYAQTSLQIVDSLQRQIHQHLQRDLTRATLLITLGDAISTSSPYEALRYTEEGLHISLEIKFAMGVASAYRQLGKIYANQASYSIAVKNSFKALKAADALPQSDPGTGLFRATVYNNLGAIQMNSGAFDKAILSFTNYLMILKYVIEVDGIRDPDLRRQTSMALLNLGEVYSRKKDFAKADSALAQSFNIAKTNKFDQVAAYALNSWGLVYSNRKKPEQAVTLFEKALVFAEQSNDLLIKSNILGGLADAMFDLKQYEKSLKYGKEALRVAKDLDLLELQRELMVVVSYAYIALKQSQMAISYADSARILGDSINMTDPRSEIVRMEERSKFEKLEAVSRAKNEAKLKQRNTILYSIISTGLLVVFGFFYYYKIKRDNNEKLNASHFKEMLLENELKVFRSQLNPHFVSNVLNSIGGYILENDPITADDYLSKFGSLIRSILLNSDNEISLNDDIRILNKYIELEQVQMKFPFHYELNIDSALDQMCTLIPFLLLQPFAENSIKHGLKTKQSDGLLKINIKQDNGMLVCTITDNGIGRHKVEEKSDYISKGLAITQARIDIINRQKNSNGYFEIFDLIIGTEVLVVIPLSIKKSFHC